MTPIIFFDTETTGTPKNYKAPASDLDNWPRIIQFAWQVADGDTGEVLRNETKLIKPDGWEVPSVQMFMKQGHSQQSAEKNAKFWIDNGFTQEQNLAEGVPMPDVLDYFINDIEEAVLIVAHNLNFDLPITSAEMFRYDRKAVNKPAKFCTMQATTDICRIPHANGRGLKWPKLEELYRFLFNKNFDGAHDAGNDVGACRESFFELLKRGLIKI